MDYSDIKKIFFKLNPENAHKIAEFMSEFLNGGGITLFR